MAIALKQVVCVWEVCVHSGQSIQKADKNVNKKTIMKHILAVPTKG